MLRARRGERRAVDELGAVAVDLHLGSVQPSTWLTSHQSTGPSFCVGSDRFSRSPRVGEHAAEARLELAVHRRAALGDAALAGPAAPADLAPRRLRRSPARARSGRGEASPGCQNRAGAARQLHVGLERHRAGEAGDEERRVAAVHDAQPPAGSAPPSAGAGVVVRLEVRATTRRRRRPKRRAKSASGAYQDVWVCHRSDRNAASRARLPSWRRSASDRRRPRAARSDLQRERPTDRRAR